MMVARSRIARATWGAGGILAVGVGGVGVIVPVLPTTVFFIIAAWCFSNCSPRMEAWVLNLRGIGPMVADYRAGLGMPRRAKLVATATMTVVVGVSVIFLISNPFARVGASALAAVGALYIWLAVPTREVVLAEQRS